jgi:hypothetical protein
MVTGVEVTSTDGDAASAKPDSRSLACNDHTRKLSCIIISGHMVHCGHLLVLKNNIHRQENRVAERDHQRIQHLEQCRIQLLKEVGAV